MSIDYTSAALIASIQRRALIPDQKLYTDSELCSILTEELHACILPMLMALNEEYFVHDNDQSIDTSVNYFSIPERAVGVKVRDVVLLNSDGREVSIPRLDPDFIKHTSVFNYGLYRTRRGFYFKNNKIYIHPDTSSWGSFSMRIKYFRRPNSIVTTNSCGKVTAINSTTVTLNNLPATWTTATSFDAIQGNPPFDSLADDSTISAVDYNNKQITFNTLPTNLAVNDWIAESHCSPIAQIPFETFNILAQRAVIKVLEGLGDANGLQQAAQVYTDMIDKFTKLITPRADGSPKKIVRSNILFGGSRFHTNWW